MTGHYFLNDPDGTFMGLGTVRVSVEVSEDGETFRGTYTFEPPAALAEAMGLPVGELGPGEFTGQRIDVEPMGEPVAPIPDPGVPSPGPVGSAPPGTSPMAPEASPAADASPMAPTESPAAG